VEEALKNGTNEYRKKIEKENGGNARGTRRTRKTRE
jgi:hypothetical protein